MNKIAASLFAGIPIVAFACVGRVSEENRPCPCASGWTCCATTQVCVPTGATCPTGDGGTALECPWPPPAGASYPRPDPSPTACRNTLFNPQHCGSCEHDCQGEACELSTCVPLDTGVLASGQLGPLSIAVDSTDVYWSSVGGDPPCGELLQIMKCAKSGCNNRPTALFSALLNPSAGLPDPKTIRGGLTVSGTAVYWGVSDALSWPSGIYACPVAGCNNHPTLLRGLVNYGEIAVNGGLLYGIGADTQGPWQLYSCSTSGCDDGGAGWNVLLSSAMAAASYSRVPMLGLTTDATRVYLDYQGIRSCAITGCDSTVPALAPENASLDAGSILPWQFVVDENNVYWDVTDYSTPGADVGEVLSCAKTGCNSAPTVLLSGLHSPRGLATDGVNLYVVDAGTGVMEGRILKCPVTGCSNQPTTIASGLNAPHAVAVDESNVYWTDLGPWGLYEPGGGRIHVAPK
jgi:hypothetical protein